MGAVFLAALFTYLLALILLPGLAVTLVIARRKYLSPVVAVMIVILTNATLGYIAFWAYFGDRRLGRTISYSTLALSIIALAPMLRHEAELRKLVKQIALPFSYVLVAGVCYICLFFLYSNPVKTGGDLGNWRFSNEVLPGDNIIPLIFAHKIYDGAPLRPFCCGDWLSSDRPPLQAGIVLLEWPFKLVNPGMQYQLVSTALQCFWICGVWCFLKSLRTSEHRIGQVLAFLILSGFLFYNSVYVWPKLLAAALILFIPAILIEALREKHALSNFEAGLAALSFSLALLAHPGGIFSMSAILLILLFRRDLVTFRTIALAVLVTVIFLGPWRAYQKFYDPPGDRLLKLHLAAVGPPDNNSFWYDLRDAYTRLPVSAIVHNKWLNLRILVGNHPVAALIPGALPPDRSGRDLIWGAVGIANVGWLAALILLFRRNRARAVPFSGPIVAAVILNLLVWCLVMFGPGQSYTPHSSYADIIAISVGLLGFLLMLPRTVCLILLGIQVVNLFLTYVFYRPASVPVLTGNRVPPHLQVSLLVLGTACVVGLLLYFGRSFFVADDLHNQ
ncbi:MAG TPA: hypothetical protein VFB14_28630 [Bryobacteraceae bacterium]|jgi:hypothetical protein|nr:hypothetical protein [Bryobacteraceae bacterium]